MRIWMGSGKMLTVSAGITSGALVRLGNKEGEDGRLSSETVAAGSTITRGPYSIATRWDVADVLSHMVEEGFGATVPGGDFSYPVAQDGSHAPPRNVFSIFDDFLHQTLTEADTPWVFNSGTDDLAIDPAIASAQGGVLRLTSGDAGTGAAADASQVVCSVPMKANAGGLVFEARLRINTAVTNAQVVAGFTDVKTLELPASIGAEDAITTTFTDGVAFVYDVGAVTDRWFGVGVADDVDAADSGDVGVAPVADVYQILRIEVDADGLSARFYIDGTLVHTITNAVTATVDLFATVIVNSTTTGSKVVDLDYVYVGHNR